MPKIQEFQQPDPDREAQAMEKALQLLKIRLHAGQELGRKLKQKGYQQAIIDRVVDKLTEQGYINDEQFAEVFFDNLIKYKTFGFYGLKAKLMQRGLDKVLIDDRLASFTLDQEFAIARKLMDKKQQKDPVKLARSLSSKGFRTEVIKKILALSFPRKRESSDGDLFLDSGSSPE